MELNLERVLDNFCFMVRESDSGIEKVIDVDLVLCVVSESDRGIESESDFDVFFLIERESDSGIESDNDRLIIFALLLDESDNGIEKLPDAILNNWRAIVSEIVDVSVIVIFLDTPITSLSGIESDNLTYMFSTNCTTASVNGIESVTFADPSSNNNYVCVNNCHGLNLICNLYYGICIHVDSSRSM